MAQVAGKTVGTNALGVMGAGAVAVVATFLPWYGVSFFGRSASVSAWNSGFIAWFPMILVVAAGGLVATEIFSSVRLPATGSLGPVLRIVVISAVAVLLILLRWATFSRPAGIDAGARFGLYLGLLAAIAQTVFGYLAFKASGERLPGK